MYDHGWNFQFTEFDIVEERDVPLLMSLPQMRNLGFQFELTPEKAYLSCARIGMRKMVLKTAISTHLILDLQDVAWFMSQVNFKTPQVKSCLKNMIILNTVKLLLNKINEMKKLW